MKKSKLLKQILIIVAIITIIPINAKAQQEVFVLEGVLKCVKFEFGGNCGEFKYYKKHIIYPDNVVNPDTNKDTSTKENTSTDKFSGVSRQLSK